MADFAIEAELIKTNYRRICGVDEVGRGSLFGPVVAGAVILHPGRLNYQYRDSKKLRHAQRLRLAHDIYENALAYSIGWCWNDDIDCSNILEATKQSMRQAVQHLQIKPDYVLVDGMAPDFLTINGRSVIKGDDKSLSIAAASIIAKVFRDFLLEKFAGFFPDFGLAQNKGYPTKKHKNMLLFKEVTIFHRKSFKLKNGC
ncbi:MAG: ribonuclease HII [Chrysiogenia bacterium]